MQICESYKLSFEDVKQKLQLIKQEFMQEPLKTDAVYNQTRTQAAPQQGRDLKRPRVKVTDSPCSSGSGGKQVSPTATRDVGQSARQRNKNKRQARALERADSGCASIQLQFLLYEQRFV